MVGLERKGQNLDQHSPVELSAMMDMFYSALSVPHTALNTWKVASETEELNF